MNADDKRRQELLSTPAEMRFADVKWVLEDDGWTERRGKGDHANFNKLGEPRPITFDTHGRRKVTRDALKAIARRIRRPSE